MRKNYIFVIMFIAIFSLSSCTPFFLKTPDDYLAENLERFWTKEAYDRAAYRIFQSAKPGVEFNQFLENLLFKLHLCKNLLESNAGFEFS